MKKYIEKRVLSELFSIDGDGLKFPEFFFF